MFKLLVVSSVLALARGSGLIAPIAPIAYSSVIAPSTTTVSKQYSSVIHPPSTPYIHAAPFYGHFLKKRSALTPITYSSNYYPTPLVHSAPLIHTPIIHPAPLIHSPLVHTPLHYLKKRSAPFISTYGYETPLIHAPIVHSTPIVHSAPLIHAPAPLIHAPFAHFIHKRSAPFLAPLIAPTSYSSQSRIDYQHSPLIHTFAAPAHYLSAPTLAHY